MTNTEDPKTAQQLTPFPNFRFKVKWDVDGQYVYVAGLNRVSALSQSTKVIRHRDGGDPSTMHVAPGQTEYSPLTFERGVSYDTYFEAWANNVYDYKNSKASTGDTTSPDFRKTFILEVYNEAGQKVMAYTVYNAWVSELQFLSDLDANGEAAILIQSMTIQNEGWERDESVTALEEPSFTLPPS